jgi:hypothetical protein
MAVRRKARFLGKAVLVLAIGALAAGLVMVLWNTVAVTAFSGAHTLDYVHALGLLVLCRLLVGGFGGRGHGRRAHWEKWQAMTPEERENFGKRWNSCSNPSVAK